MLKELFRIIACFAVLCRNRLQQRVSDVALSQQKNGSGNYGIKIFMKMNIAGHHIIA
jgi:hypothetical protein